MNKAYLVALREYMENLRTKTFWLGIMIFPVILFLSFAVPYWLEREKDVRKYAVIDNTGWLLEKVEELSAMPDLEKVLFETLKMHERESKDFKNLPEKLQEITLGLTQTIQGIYKIKNVVSEPSKKEQPESWSKWKKKRDDIRKSQVKQSAKLFTLMSEPEDQRMIVDLLNINKPLLKELVPEGKWDEAEKRIEEFNKFDENYKKPIQHWYQNLPPEEAKRYGSSLAKGRYARENVQLSGKVEDDEVKLKEMLNRNELFAYIVISEDPVGEPPEKRQSDESGVLDNLKNMLSGNEQGLDSVNAEKPVVELPESDQPEIQQSVVNNIVGSEPPEESKFKYVSKNLTDTDLKNWFERYANNAINERRIKEAGISEKTAEWLKKRFEFDTKQISEKGKEEEVDKKDMAKQWAPAGFTYALWISVFMIAQMLLTNTIEEKSNKIMEVLLSSVSPIQLMAGKIIGIASTGLTMVVSWVIFFIIGVKCMPLIFEGMPDLGLGAIVADPIYLGSFVIYFILGYLLLSAILVGIGSVCNSLKEAQNLMGPVTIIMIVPLMALVPISRDPNGTIAQVLSYIPPFTPFVMMNRAAGPPTTMEYVVTTILLVISIAITLWAAAKIFRIGILMTGKPPKPLEILRWVKAPVGQIPVKKEE